MANEIRDGAGNLIIPASQAGNRGMDKDTPFYVLSVTSTGADTQGSGVQASSATPTNTSTVTADVSGTLTAATNAAPVAANLARQLAIISNTGANPMSVRFGAAATATVGHVIPANGTMVLDSKVPTAAINLFSTLGTTYHITTG